MLQHPAVAALLSCLLLLLRLATAQECPCWPEEKPDRFCTDKETALKYSASDVFSDTFTQCVNRVSYSAQYGGYTGTNSRFACTHHTHTHTHTQTHTHTPQTHTQTRKHTHTHTHTQCTHTHTHTMHTQTHTHTHTHTCTHTCTPPPPHPTQILSGALMVPLCWNRGCLPEKFSRQTLELSINVRSEDLTE